MSRRLAEVDTGEIDLVVFSIDGVMCALGIDEVQEIKRIAFVTRVHHGPEYVAGVVNLRGQIVTLIDLRKRLKYDSCTIDNSSRMIVVKRGDEQIGLLVDSIEDAVVARSEEIVQPPSNVQGAEGRFFRGVYTSSDSLIAILDKDAILEKEKTDSGVSGTGAVFE
jgi:purine-binding chemotaxis protein CheW